MKKYIFPLSIAASVVLFSSCSDDDDAAVDTQKPVISGVTINGSSEDVEVNTGAEIHIDAVITDNEALGELKIDVHDVFDDHSHGKKAGIHWAEIKTMDLSGKQQTIHTHMDVPSDALGGPYHAVFRVIDAEGNEGDFAEVDFSVISDDQPVINIITPDFSSEPEWAKGDMVSVTGTITDETDISEIVIVLEEEGDHDHNHGKKAEEALYEEDFDLTGTNDVTWDFQSDGNVNFTIPADAETGHYAFIINVMDSEGNLTVFEKEVEIVE
jgi:hypothetical protein